ncbi:MAG TPA: EpsI family protein [Gemmatimonadales bacterium]|nr:EpsI family protein [Gemmatimonadales bacterium]
MPLVAPFAQVIPGEIAGYRGRDARMADWEVTVVGVSTYLLRNYEAPTDPDRDWFSVYVGYYDRQTQGRTIHSPKNCLPGAGWEALASSTTDIATPRGTFTVNRYLLQNKQQQALVLYWYQGRGRIEANEYRVKWNLLRDAAVRQRTEEALVRIVVPLTGDDTGALDLATRAAAELIPALELALPRG